MRLSIIVPVYNVQDYLKKCLDSLFNQDIEINEYEVITVNDGSTDDSLKILNELRLIYPSINIITQENQGLSAARNKGIEKANGDYILFVDSDDYILKNSLKLILNIVEKHDLDILEFGAEGISETSKIIYVSKSSTKNKVLTGEKYLTNISYMSSACNKLYKRTFLNANNLKFMRDVYIEDIEFNTRAVFKAEKIQAIDTIIARFLQRDGSITRTNNITKTKKMIYDIYTVLSSINQFNETFITNKSTAYLPVKKRTCALISTMLLRVLTGINDYNIKKDIFDKLKNQNLYPIPYKTGDKKKDKFRWFSNQNILFSLTCKFYCIKNK
ncbi:glycosyltransferase [Algibacter sp. L4_22]|uniref:glycosyltransferase n=1 Tax=Algibacter sp. L4_22 TaxID=2942477 RepID=UPI00201B6BDF|nr:glycosyltransferase [Algibacter sp. L4_22]MCL5127859.1 glycosyltransferase [Algibacter sp. L4_22]